MNYKQNQKQNEENQKQNTSKKKTSHLDKSLKNFQFYY